MQSIADNLLGSTRAAILATLLLRPEEALHVRELARSTGISPGTLHRELQDLTRLGLLNRREAGRQVFYSANRSSPIFDDLASLLRKTRGLADRLREALAPLADKIRVAFVYGSMAVGDVTTHSDVDLMVVGDVGFADVVAAVGPLGAELRREINPTVMRRAEFTRKARERSGFVRNVLRNPKIWLYGNDDDLAEPGKDRPA